MDISDYSPHATARRFDAGTPPVPNIYAGVAGLGLVQETGVPAIEAHVAALNTRLIAGLEELGADVVTPADPARRGPLVCVRSTDAPALVASLAEENIVCSLRDTNLRVAAHYYNTDERHRRAPRRAVAPPAAARLTAWLRAMRLPPARQIAYGDHPDQVGNLHLPAGDRDGPWPAVVLIHGGFWRYGWDRTLMTPLARDLAARGIAAWNIEYRRVGQEGGGWPGTLEDVAAAADAVVGLEGVDASRVATVGHSAGGHLALWLAARHRLPAGAPAPIRASGRAARSRRRASATSSPEPGPASAAARARRSSAASPTMSRSATRSPHPRRCCRSACRSSSSTARATTSCHPARAATTRRRRERRATRSISSSGRWGAGRSRARAPARPALLLEGEAGRARRGRGRHLARPHHARRRHRPPRADGRRATTSSRSTRSSRARRPAAARSRSSSGRTTARGARRCSSATCRRARRRGTTTSTTRSSGSGAARAATTSATRSSRSRTAAAFRITPREVHIVENTHPERELAVLGIFTPGGQPVGRVPDARHRSDLRVRLGMSAVSARVGAAIRASSRSSSTATYLNSCSQGALSHRVRDADEEWLAGWDENGAEWDFWVERNEAFRRHRRLLHARRRRRRRHDLRLAGRQRDRLGAPARARRAEPHRDQRVRVPDRRPDRPRAGAARRRGRARRGRTPTARSPPSASRRRSTSGRRSSAARRSRTAPGHRHDVAAIAEAAHAPARSSWPTATRPRRDRARRPHARRRRRHRRDGQVPARNGGPRLPVGAARGAARGSCRPRRAGSRTRTSSHVDRRLLAARERPAVRRGHAARAALYAGVAGISLVEEAGVPAIEAHVRGPRDAAARRARGARRDGRHPARPGPQRAPRLRALDRRGGAGRRARGGAIVVSSRDDNLGRARTSTTSRRTSTRCSTRSRRHRARSLA